jgi:2',3'-cyclic-nucleotide 2'-phosphodiesterase (5'-nucleotidase family)
MSMKSLRNPAAAGPGAAQTRRLLGRAVAALSLAAFSFGAPAQAPAAPAYTLQLLHFADVDGSDTTALGSVANFSGLVQRFRAAYPEHTLLVSSGDNVIPGPRFNAADNQGTMRALLGREGVGRGDIALMNALGVQASALGNHDLDLGTGTFREMIAPQVSGGNVVWPGARFPYLSYNTDFSRDANTRSLVAPNGRPLQELNGKVAGWARVSVGGQTIGVIGASSPVFKAITSIGGLVIDPPLRGTEVDIDGLAARIQSGVDEMTAAGIDKIVLLAHMQSIEVEKALAARLRGVDIIVAGGSNTLMADADDALRPGDRAAEPYPHLARSASGEPVVVVNTDADYKYLGRFIAPFDGRGVLMPQHFDSRLSGAWAAAQGDDTAGGVTPLPQVVQIRDGLRRVINASDGVFYGYSRVFLEGRRQAVRTEETNLGNLSADANLAYARDIDPTVQVSLKNGGGIRAEVGAVVAPPGSTSGARLEPPLANPDAGRPAGAVSRLMLEAAFKFDNKLWVFDVSAARLHALLEFGVADVENVGGRFPQVGGLRFSFDPQAAKGTLAADGSSTTPGRVRSLKVGDDVVVRDGVVQGDPNRSFRLVTLNFLATGGDGYRFGAANPQGDGLGRLLKLDAHPRAGAALGGQVGLPPGGEQDALAEHLLQRHRDTPYAEADSPPEQDTRIQNLRRRADTVLP